MSSGVFAVSRDIFDHEFFADEPYSEREAWLWLIGNAAWKPCRVRRGRGAVDLSRGQVAATARELAEKWGWSKSRVDRFLGRLSEAAMIAADGSTGRSGGTVITICNYDTYQFGGAEGDEAGQIWDKSGTKSGTIAGQKKSSKNRDLFENEYSERDIENDAVEQDAGQSIYREEDNNIKNTPISLRDMPPQGGETTTVEKPSLPKSPKGTRIPDDWSPSPEDRQYALSKGIPADKIDEVAEEFLNHWQIEPGARGRKLDWSKTWRNRCIAVGGRFAQRQNRNSCGPPPPPQHRNGAAAAYEKYTSNIRDMILEAENVRPSQPAFDLDDIDRQEPHDGRRAEAEILAPRRGKSRDFDPRQPPVFDHENRTDGLQDLGDL
ncbi:hypothetical protein ACUSIJ_28855 [Pseudochelatococcus sp. B33]